MRAATPNTEALEFEIGRIPDAQRRAKANAMLTLAHEHLRLDTTVESVAARLEKRGLSAMDALHVALASEARADFFATTDDQLLRRRLTITALNCRPVSILGLISEIPK